jgi:hypothetical protein
MDEENFRSFFNRLYEGMIRCGCNEICAHLIEISAFPQPPTTKGTDRSREEKGAPTDDSGALFPGAVEPPPPLKAPPPRLKFRPKNLAEVVEFFERAALRGNPDAWFLFWESRAWKEVRDWKARARHYSTTDIAIRDEEALAKRKQKPPAAASSPVEKLQRPAPGLPIWQDAAGSLRLKMDPKLFDTWFRPVEQLEYREDGVLVLLIPSDGFRWAFQHYGQRIQEAARSSAGRTVTIKLCLAPEYEPR